MKFLIAFAVSGLVFTCVAMGEFLTQAVDVTVAGKPLHFDAGQAVTVVGVMQGNALVRAQLPDGSATIAQIPANLLSRTAPGATPAPAPSSSPTPNANPRTSNSRSSPNSTFPAPTDKGQLLKNRKFPELPKFTQRTFWWMNFEFKPADETFELYIPPAPPAGQKYDVLGWISSGDGNVIPRQFLPLLDKYHIIAVSAKNCGNRRDTGRRIGLMVSAMIELQKHYAIDPNEHLLSGCSGGGRASTWGGFTMPDFFSGVIAWCGTYFPHSSPNYENGKLDPTHYKYGINHWMTDKEKREGKKYVTPSDEAIAHSRTRFAMMTGSKDSNHDDTFSYYTAAKRAGYQVMFYSQDGMGHDVGNAASTEKALQFVLQKSATSQDFH